MTPTRMADAARGVAEATGLEFDVIEREGMVEHGMGALLGVAQGSEEPPKLIVLKYHGDPDHPENNLGLVGKGITFDTGGISLKPAANMEAMKGDMAGGASVIAAMSAIGTLQPKINVTGLIAATENMPGGRAQRPGDVVTAMNGKTIEVINTDAEGRLVSADALCYARKLGITRLVDVATLTGAIVVTLGKVCTGIMGNSAALAGGIKSAGERSGERFWELPMLEDYRELIRSDVADMKNTGGRQAGSITAAMLLRELPKTPNGCTSISRELPPRPTIKGIWSRAQRVSPPARWRSWPLHWPTAVEPIISLDGIATTPRRWTHAQQ
ncbi:Probable cytosol aminopeptidase [Geodia barretti]|nr:Probable cytosol aminopeptidase [Geodia barretti]